MCCLKVIPCNFYKILAWINLFQGVRADLACLNAHCKENMRKICESDSYYTLEVYFFGRKLPA
jgi:hypothetical protein